MRLQLLSDLHLETQPDFVAPVVPGADLLVLAGDVGSYQSGSQLAEDDFGLGRFSPRRGAPWKRVLYVPGNHEYDGLEFDTAHARLRALCEELGIVWLEREVLELEGIRFVGCTLWTDFDALAAGAPAAEALAQRGKAFRAADYYLSRNTTLRDGRPMLAADLRELGLASQAWLEQALRTPHDGPTVVITHFAPSLRSADPRYGVTPATAGFCNALDHLLPHADLWLHGHLHCRNDYVVEGEHDGRHWRCRVAANPLGYARKGEQAAFRADFFIDLPNELQALRGAQT
ncbi:metallophosphoesterase [Caldimonas thermodepolymerans]|uniref:Calcineurin-like phosphoesterase family protein n=1 Tax=Caldimonas thermodepolymerans TaxID=215580 RepID=A0AA46DF95_9BURK|nr:metallophosphoesterase [Caldimonas thermodepolymerans]TCP07629.1 calcineurin-like phosphoesterase family protein [Caldimonas thermodepolymerans]UZG44134.1 metallophosphoesterase [Caldimonas thermodepolymerans]UZG47801.1 metallophosphoesterase [Caldimonas thermodepolymerans]